MYIYLGHGRSLLRNLSSDERCAALTATTAAAIDLGNMKLNEVHCHTFFNCTCQPLRRRLSLADMYVSILPLFIGIISSL